MLVYAPPSTFLLLVEFPRPYSVPKPESASDPASLQVALSSTGVAGSAPTAAAKQQLAEPVSTSESSVQSGKVLSTPLSNLVALLLCANSHRTCCFTLHLALPPALVRKTASRVRLWQCSGFPQLSALTERLNRDAYTLRREGSQHSFPSSRGSWEEGCDASLRGQ
eukprot:188767-Rhodomonas_salina.1